MSERDSFRQGIRRQLTARYRQAARNGSLTPAMIRENISQLEAALAKARRTNGRVIVEGQEHLGTLSEVEIEDQLYAIKEAAKQ